MSSTKRRPAVLWLWYHGASFVGFQAQPGARTVQATLLEGLSAIGLSAGIMPAGRTDRAVHARMQVISLRMPADQDPSGLPARLSAVLPPDLGVAAATWAPRGFHAQWSASGKEYRYRLAPGGLSPAWVDSAWDLSEHPGLPPRALDPRRLAQALEWMVGTRDFFAFHESSSPRKPRALREASLVQLAGGAVLEVRLRGEGFGRYMVRYLVGAAVAYACGVLEEGTLRAALDHATPFAGLKAPGKGLVLWAVEYPPQLAPFDSRGISLPAGPPFEGTDGVGPSD